VKFFMVVVKKDKFLKNIFNCNLKNKIEKKLIFAYKIIVKKFINKEYIILFSIKYNKNKWRNTPNSARII